jgi:hypothetical protein
MKVLRLLLAPCLFLAAPLFSFSQLYFVENKGQWDQQVHFKTEAGNSAFFLTKDGYSILMNHPEIISAWQNSIMVMGSIH